MAERVSANLGTPTQRHPQLFYALDDLARWVEPTAQGSAARIPGVGADHDHFDRILLGVEETIRRSPPWPLLNAILARIGPIASAVRQSRAEVVVSAEDGHLLRVLIQSAHEQEGERRPVWTVRRPKCDLRIELAALPPETRGVVIHSLWTAAGPYVNAAYSLVEAIRAARGPTDVVSWGFLTERKESEESAHRVALDIVMGRRRLPRTFAETADAIADPDRARRSGRRERPPAKDTLDRELIAVEVARADTWEEIGARRGVSKQAAMKWKKYPEVQRALELRAQDRVDRASEMSGNDAVSGAADCFESDDGDAKATRKVASQRRRRAAKRAD